MSLWLIIMTAVAGVLLILSFFQRSMIWALALPGAIIGLILAIVKHDWNLLALCFAIGAFIGLGVELLGMLSDRLKRTKFYKDNKKQS
jgi:hypothetical protein